MNKDDRSCCSRTFHPIAKEFRKENFGLSHQPVDVFLKSQWQTSQKSYLWLLYRWSLAICFCVGVFGSSVKNWSHGLWFLYLTNWGFTLCMFVSVFGAILVTIHHLKPQMFSDNSKVIKFYWVTHWTTLVTSTLVSSLYWSLIYPYADASASDLYNLWAHGFNSILMVLDHMLVAFPTRFLHFIYPTMLGITYCIFSIIYYFAGGVDPFGNHYIYEISDWSKPEGAILLQVINLVVLLLSSFLLFCLYKLRTYIYRKCINTKLSNATMTFNQNKV